jgi:hypothetical protein
MNAIIGWSYLTLKTAKKQVSVAASPETHQAFYAVLEGL